MADILRKRCGEKLNKSSTQLMKSYEIG